MSNALLRILTAVIGIPVLLGSAYLGGWYFAVPVLALALASQYEIYLMMEEEGMRPHKTAGLTVGALVVLHPLQPGLLAAALALFLAFLALAAVMDVKRQPLSGIAGTLFGIVYPCLLFAFLLMLREDGPPAVSEQQAFLLTLSLFVLIWMTDTGAYYVGKSIGKHALAPNISPNKTWEGSVGGAMAAVVAAVVLRVSVLDFVDWPHVVALALICGVVSQLGDLTESRFKRSVGVKDSSRIIPGHGGVLDRFDALLLAAPLYYLYLVFVAGLW